MIDEFTTQSKEEMKQKLKDSGKRMGKIISTPVRIDVTENGVMAQCQMPGNMNEFISVAKALSQLNDTLKKKLVEMITGSLEEAENESDDNNLLDELKDKLKTKSKSEIKQLVKDITGLIDGK